MTANFYEKVNMKIYTNYNDCPIFLKSKGIYYYFNNGEIKKADFMIGYIISSIIEDLIDDNCEETKKFEPAEELSYYVTNNMIKFLKYNDSYYGFRNGELHKILESNHIEILLQKNVECGQYLKKNNSKNTLLGELTICFIDNYKSDDIKYLHKKIKDYKKTIKHLLKHNKEDRKERDPYDYYMSLCGV